jgi:pimeloyl-ACP methyl ester carboxylesterase
VDGVHFQPASPAFWAAAVNVEALSILLVNLAFCCILILKPTEGTSMPDPANNKPSIVLVHGAFADASSWQKVILGLEGKGFVVTAVQIPLRSLADDIATTARVLEAQSGDVVLVGHSYGGAVITGAGAGSSKVKALVYVSAFAPDAGEVLSALIATQSPPLLLTSLVPDSAGFLCVDRTKFREVIAADVTDSEAAVLAATQKPLAGAIFGESVSAAAWKTIPSWYIVSSQDNGINPDLERFMAKRMKAQVTELAASHVPFISRPAEVTEVIEAAAGAVS